MTCRFSLHMAWIKSLNRNVRAFLCFVLFELNYTEKTPTTIINIDFVLL